MFLTPEVERKTYIDIIKGILGEFGLNEPKKFAEVYGMDVTAQVIRKFKESSVEVAKEAFSSPVSVSRESVETFIDWLLADAVYNVQAIPDQVEQALYANCFELFLEAFLKTTQNVEFTILNRNLTIKTRIATDVPRNYTKIRRFRPDWLQLDLIAEETRIEPKALKKITSNVHAFALVFVNQILDDASAVILGHEMKLVLTTPTVLKISQAFEGNKDGSFSAMSALNALAEELAAVAAISKKSNDTTSYDAIAFDAFKRYCTPPDDRFLFPYLSKEQFKIAVSEVMRKAGFRNVHKVVKEKMNALADAADEDRNGVIQWGEFLLTSSAIVQAIDARNTLKN